MLAITPVLLVPFLLSVYSNPHDKEAPKTVCNSSFLHENMTGICSTDALSNCFLRECPTEISQSNKFFVGIKEKVPEAYDTNWDLNGIAIRPFLWIPKTSFFHNNKSSLLVSFSLTPSCQKIYIKMYQERKSTEVNWKCAEIDLSTSKWKNENAEVVYDCFGNLAVNCNSSVIVINLYITIEQDGKWSKYSYLIFMSSYWKALKSNNPNEFFPTVIIRSAMLNRGEVHFYFEPMQTRNEYEVTLVKRGSGVVARKQIQTDEKRNLVFGHFGDVETGTHLLSIKALGCSSGNCTQEFPPFEVVNSKQYYNVIAVIASICAFVVIVLAALCVVIYKRLNSPSPQPNNPFKIFMIQEDGMQCGIVKTLEKRLPGLFEGVKVMTRSDCNSFSNNAFSFYGWLRTEKFDYFLLFAKTYFNENCQGNDSSQCLAVQHTFKYLNDHFIPFYDKVTLFHFRSYKEKKNILSAKRYLMPGSDEGYSSEEQRNKLAGEIEKELSKIFTRKGLKKNKSLKTLST